MSEDPAPFPRPEGEQVLHTYDVTIHFDGTRITQPVQAEDMDRATGIAGGLVRRHRAVKQAHRLYIERRGRMTYRAEIDGMAVPESMTTGAVSHEDAALRVAQISYPGKVVTVDAAIGGELDRRWFEVTADPESGRNIVAEVVKTASGNVFRLGGCDD